MRHFYIRLIIGIVWIIAAAVSLFNSNYTAMGLYLLLGAVFLYSAYSIRKKEKDKNRKG